MAEFRLLLSRQAELCGLAQIEGPVCFDPMLDGRAISHLSIFLVDLLGRFDSLRVTPSLKQIEDGVVLIRRVFFG